jgi:hypothetical protein
MRFSGRLLLDAPDWLGALYGLPHAVLRLGRSRSCPRRCQEQEHRGGVEQQRHDENKPAHHALVGLA